MRSRSDIIALNSRKQALMVRRKRYWRRERLRVIRVREQMKLVNEYEASPYEPSLLDLAWLLSMGVRW